MHICEKCGSPLNKQQVCTECGIDHSSFFRDTAIAMKVLGIISGAIGVGLIAFSDHLKTSGLVKHPYDVWLSAGLFIVIGFVMFIREWKA